MQTARTRPCNSRVCVNAPHGYTYTRVHDRLQAVYTAAYTARTPPSTRPVYTNMYTAVYGPCTRPVYTTRVYDGPSTRLRTGRVLVYTPRVHGRVTVMYTAVYTNMFV